MTDQIKTALITAIEAAIIRRDMDNSPHENAKAAAAAALELLGPKPLDWINSYGALRAHTPHGDYVITGKILRVPGRMGAEMVCGCVQSAQSAAQSHANLGHWANTPIGDLIGGEG